MTLRILVRFFVLIAVSAVSSIFVSPLSVWADDSGSGRSGSALYQTPVQSGEFLITQYPERVVPEFDCSHTTGTRNGEAYDLISRVKSPRTPILAVADGTVEFFGAEDERDISAGYGNYVLLEHARGIRSVYAHLDRFSFNPTQMGVYTAYRENPSKNEPLTVLAGDTIGIMGSTGISGGNIHLHFSLYTSAGRSLKNILGTPERAESYIPDFVLNERNKIEIASREAFSLDGCPEGVRSRASGAGQGGFSGASGSGSSGSVVTVKTGSLGFRILYERVNSLYAFSIGIGGILAFLLIIYAGIRYSLSLGNASKAKEALDQVQAALTGLVLLLALYPILYTVNPCIVDPLRMGDRRDKEGRIVRVPICAVSQHFDARSGSVTVGSPPIVQKSASTPVFSRECKGPGSYEQSRAGGKLTDIAKLLCVTQGRGTLPTEGAVHDTLVRAAGAENCTADDVRKVLADPQCSRLSSAGGSAGGTSITADTVAAVLCAVTPVVGPGGIVFEPPSDVRAAKSIPHPIDNTGGNLTDSQARENVTQIAKNVPALVAYCKAQSAALKWCSDQVGVALETKAPLALKDLTPEQERLLVDVCADVGGFGKPKEYFPAPVSTMPTTPVLKGDWIVRFTDQSGQPVQEAKKGETLQLITHVGLPQTEEVFFEIFELNFLRNDAIRTVAGKNPILATVGNDGVARAMWTITQADLLRGDESSGYFEFALGARTTSGSSRSQRYVSGEAVVRVHTDEMKKPDPPTTP